MSEIISDHDIAIIATSCRFPAGAESPEKFWKNLENGVDAVREVPRNRFNWRRFFSADQQKPGTTYVARGGFLDWDPEMFEPAQFGISPREAENMDPQQRILLILTEELFSRAGYKVDSFKGSNTGVFVGGFCVDNLLLKLGVNNWDAINLHTATGSTLTMLANRISHTFDFCGPSFALDTACSSSLVALHQAVSSLKNGDCDQAIAGGVNFMMAPEYYIAMSKAKLLSPAARCAVFDAAADGYVRGEGGGLLLLKHYKAACEDEDPILGIIAGSGVNQDGYTPGITLPNRTAQKRLLEKVTATSGVSQDRFGYIEAHGTGTRAGDAAESWSLNEVFGNGPDDGVPIFVGSVKSNIGHLEAAAGVAGVIKALLVLHHCEIPSNLHFETPNPDLAWNDRFKVAVGPMPIKLARNKDAVLVNSFGYGGTNAAVILRRVPRQQDSEANRKTPRLQHSEPMEDLPVPLAAYHPDDITLQAAELVAHGRTESSYGLLYTNAVTQASRPYRRLIFTSDVADIPSVLAKRDKVTAPSQAVEDPKFSLIYSGMGPHWWKMGRELFQTEPVFRDSILEIDCIFSEIAGFSFLMEMGDSELSSKSGETEIDQPAGFALQVSLTRLLAFRGVRPVAVLGHSLGEVAAFWASGLLTLEDAIRVVFTRSTLQARLKGKGGMLATFLCQSDAEAIISQAPTLSIAAFNSANMITLCGPESDLAEVATQLDQRGIFNKKLKVQLAYHSRYMEEVEDDLKHALANVKFDYQAQHTTLYSTVTGDCFEEQMDVADYWYANVRQPVMFESAISALARDIAPQFLEVGPHPILMHAVKETLFNLQLKRRYLYTLHRQEPEQQRLTALWQELYELGLDLEWKSWFKDRKIVPHSTTARPRKRMWIETVMSQQTRLGLNGSPFQFNQINGPGICWSVDLNVNFFPWMPDHRLTGDVVFPGAGYIEAMLAGLLKVRPQTEKIELTQVSFQTLCKIVDGSNQLLFTKYDPDAESLEVYSGLRGIPEQQALHAVSRVGDTSPDIPEMPFHKANQSFTADAFYQNTQTLGFNYGPAFQTVTGISLGDATIQVSLETSFTHAQAAVYPPLLDGAFQGAIGLIIAKPEFRSQMVPQSIARLIFARSPNTRCQARIEVKKLSSRELIANLWLFDHEGPLIYVEGLRFAARSETLLQMSDAYVQSWTLLDLGERQEEKANNSALCDVTVLPRSIDSPVTERLNQLGADRLGLALQKVSYVVLASDGNVAADLSQVESLMCDTIIPALQHSAPGELRLIVVQPSDALSPLADMLDVLTKVAELESYPCKVRLSFGSEAELLAELPTLFDGETRTTRLSGISRLVPEIKKSLRPNLPSLPPSPGQQVEFDWPSGNLQGSSVWSTDTLIYSRRLVSGKRLFGAWLCTAADRQNTALFFDTKPSLLRLSKLPDHHINIPSIVGGWQIERAVFRLVIDMALAPLLTEGRQYGIHCSNPAIISLIDDVMATNVLLRASTPASLKAGDILFECEALDSQYPITIGLNVVRPFDLEGAGLGSNHFIIQPNLLSLCEDSRSGLLNGIRDLLIDNAFPETGRDNVQEALDFIDLEVNPPLVTQRLPLIGKAVLVVGGSGGFGLKFAEWLVSIGVARVVITSRSGRLKEREGSELVDGIELCRLDARNADAVERFFAEDARNSKPISAIFHAAMVLNDKPMVELTHNDIREVTAPKVDGALILDRISRRYEITHFVMFSSVTSALGNRNQAAYAVANRALESIVRARVEEGLPGLAIQWGAISDAGIVHRTDGLEQILKYNKINLLKSEDAFARVFFDLIEPVSPVVGIFRLDEKQRQQNQLTQSVFIRDLQDMPRQSKLEKLDEVSIEILSRVLKLDATSVRQDTKVSSLGIDSLMLVEILICYEEKLSISVQSNMFFGNLTVREVSLEILDLINKRQDDIDS